MNWKKLLDALIEKESGGNPNAIGDNGWAIGILQAHKKVVDDVNTFYGLNFSYDDRLNPEKSKIICILYVTYWVNHWISKSVLLREPTVQDYALCWHYGPSFYKFRVEDRDHYWNDISTYINT